MLFLMFYLARKIDITAHFMQNSKNNIKKLVKCMNII